MDAGDEELVSLFQGATEWLTLLILLALPLQLWTWAADRGLRPADRGGRSGWLLVLLSFGLVVVMRLLHAEWTMALVLCGSLLVAGLLSRMVHDLRLGVPAMLLAGLLGLGHVLSAIVLALLGTLVLLLSRPGR